MSAALALPILSFTSGSDPPCSMMSLFIYVKIYTSSGASPSNEFGSIDVLKTTSVATASAPAGPSIHKRRP
ncbi:unnamed protein product [Schistosoma margrebowiei]|uniref:Uncharacterized protein n=1 Tax=Schistosoma margrebowiei TaxID=48269 RepID=A0A183MZG0_9TREM|nr:unnamed protein product [Schistosoma margrebowiei]